MSREQPAGDCREVVFSRFLLMSESAEVALEDYARELTGAGRAEAVRQAGEPSGVSSVHLCGVASAPSASVLADIEGFARTLEAPEASGLGWS